jgi:hypothetical protein
MLLSTSKTDFIFRHFSQNLIPKNGTCLIPTKYLIFKFDYTFKICEITYARIQGRNALLNHFEFSSIMNQNVLKICDYFWRIKKLSLFSFLKKSLSISRN